MGKLFDLDSPIMRFLSRAADLLWLNILVIVFHIPLFIPLGLVFWFGGPLPLLFVFLILGFLPTGAILTGMHYVLLKMARNEEGYITQSFFKSFKENWKQATQLWLIFLAFAVVFILDFFMIRFSGASFPGWLQIALVVVGVIVYSVSLYAFPLEARFVNTVRGTLKNAAIMVIAAFPRTLGMIAVGIIPWVVLYFSTALVPVVLMFGISLPGYVSALLYSPLFKKFEPKEEEKDPDAMPEALMDDTPVQNPSMIDAADRRAAEEAERMERAGEDVREAESDPAVKKAEDDAAQAAKER